MIEPRSAGEDVVDTLTRAKNLIESRDYDSAALLLFQVLDRDLAAPLRGEVLTNLGAALCMSARGQQGEDALTRLEEARNLLAKALTHRSRSQAPAAWATTRANLALVHLTRYETTGNMDDLLSAHLALDGTEPALRSTDDTALRDWINAIRDQLVELRDRRSFRR
ncbi:MAG: hypothetical protein WBA73_21085 [Devosia sp.]